MRMIKLGSVAVWLACLSPAWAQAPREMEVWPPPTDGEGGSPGDGSIHTANYDVTYKVPRCTALGAGCDSGTLLNGCGGVGPEVNMPNTLHARCWDGAAGGYHVDESNDRLRVSTTDGSNLAGGKTVKVEASVYAYSTTRTSWTCTIR